MSAQWIKLCHDTPRKPEVLRIARAAGIHPDEAFGIVMRLMLWLDSVTEDGDLGGLTLEDCHAAVTPEARHERVMPAIVAVGWLAVRDDGSVYAPNFTRHNGKSAKSRAQSNDRKRRERGDCHASVTHMSRSERDASVTREEKKERKKEGTADAKPEDPNALTSLEWGMADGSVQRLTDDEVESLRVMHPNVDIDFAVRQAWGHHRGLAQHEKPRSLQAVCNGWIANSRGTPQGRRNLQVHHDAPSKPRIPSGGMSPEELAYLKAEEQADERRKAERRGAVQ